MLADAPPTDDAGRLAALSAYDILDTPPEKGFDDVVTLATLLCGTPVALVSLVDRDRQWFKARTGFEPCETDLNSSVCRFVLGRTDILQIVDLTLDPRTRDNPLVTGAPHIRFYAGAPLTTPDGRTLGSLCVIDTVPRPEGLTDPQRVGLRALAGQVMAQLELRRALADREAAQVVALAEAARLEAMIATQQAVASAEADLSVVFQAIVDGALTVIEAADGAVVELRNGDDLVYDTVSGTSARHKGIRLPVTKTLSGRAVATERPLYCGDTQADGEANHALAIGLGIRSMVVVPVTRRGEPIGALKVQSAKSDAFSPRDMVMTQMLAGLVASAFGDVAEAKSQRALRQAEVRYRQTFESVTEFGVVVTDRDGTVTEWNTGAERIFGWTEAEMRGHDAERFFTPEDRGIDRLGVEMATSLREGSAVDERWHLRKDGSRFYASGNMMPLRGDDGGHIGFIKIVRDRTEQHLTGLRLDRSERQLRQAQEAGGIGLFTIDVETDELTGTPEFSRLYGLEHSAVRPATEIEATVVPEDAHLVATAATRRDDRVIRDVRYRIRRPADGAVRWIGRQVEVERAAGGRPVRYSGASRDITDQVEAEGRVASSEAKWRGLFENLQEGFVLGRVVRDGTGRIVDWRYEQVNRAWGDLTGIDPATVVGRTVREVIPGVEDEWVNEFADVVATGEPVHFTRQVGPLERWYDGVCQPASEDRFTLIFLEVTGRIEAQRLLDAAEERRRLATDVGEVGLWELDLATSELTLDARMRAMNGVTGPVLDAAGAFAAVHPDDRTRLDAELKRLAAGDTDALSIEYRVVGIEDALVRTVAVNALAVRGENGAATRLVGAARDVTARVAADERRVILNRELAHRLKNTLAVVQSIATQTLRTAPDMPTARMTLLQRIAVLSKAHEMLLTGERDAASIRDVVEAATALHDGGGRVRTTGPDVPMGPKASMTLSLILHELSTNAGKYGALSVDGGHVDVAWTVEPEPATRRPFLTFKWREVGGPPVTEPTKKSFGTRLIGMGLSGAADGTSEIDYAPDGLRCRLTASLTEVQAEE